MRRLVSIVSSLSVLAIPATAAAHIAMTYPAPRSVDQKVGPCGPIGSVRGTNVTVLEPGAMLEVSWSETINHPGHYRVSFDDDGQDFTVPNDFTDTTQTTNVLVDLIADQAGGAYTQLIQLPSTPCENCTLQLFQMMYDKAPYGDGNDIYFQCADIALRVGGGPGPDAGNGGTGADGGTDPITDPDETISGGCAAAPTRGSSSWFLLALGTLGLALCRRRRH